MGFCTRMPPAAVHHHVEVAGAQRSASGAQVRLVHQLDAQPHGCGQLLQLGVEGGRTGDDAHLLARGGPGVDGGDDHGCRHHGEEDEGDHSKQAAPQPLPDLAPGHKSGVSEEPPAAKSAGEPAEPVTIGPRPLRRKPRRTSSTTATAARMNGSAFTGPPPP